MPKKSAALGAALVTTACLPLLWVAVAQEKDGDAKAGVERFKVDNVHACVWFKINHLGFADFYGRFNTIEGTFAFEDGRPANNNIDIRVKTATVDTNNAKRDEHLRSADFFDAEKYPEIRFQSRKFKKVGERKFEVTGDLSLHGVTKPITITLQRNKSGQDPWGNYRTGIATEFTIKRTDYGMKTMVGPLSDEVTLTISLEGIRQ